MATKLVACDFEYCQSKEPKLNLVCCSLVTKNKKKSYWLHTPRSEFGLNWYNSNRKELKKDIKELHEKGFIFLSYSAIAEARSFLALGLNPLDYRWIDLHLEYRCLLNHDHSLMYGKQLKKGRVVYTKPPKPKWQRDEREEKDADNSKPEYGLGAATFKLLGKKIDSAFKEATRDLIISDPDVFSEEEKEQIMEYCEEDTSNMIDLFHAMRNKYKEKLGRDYKSLELRDEMFWRANYAVRSAYMEELGYPIDMDITRNFSDQVGSIIFQCQKEIIEMFPDNPPFYKFKRKEGLFTLHQKAIREEIKKWLKAHPKAKWMLTDGGESGKKDYSLSLKAFTRHFNYTHSYPKGNYFAQIIRYLKLKQNLNGFLPGGKNFWDYVGSDSFVRPYMGIYVAQSSRSQPSATGFIPLKSAWMRYMIVPPEGYAMASIDFKSQEFLIAALLSGDKQMLEDYLSGDVYLAFGKSIGFIPKDGTKAKYKKERDQMKPVVLGIQFDMTEIGLAKDLTEKWGRVVTEKEALGYLNAHKKAYPTLWRYKDQIAREYRLRGYLKLADGWYMWGDNKNFRSVGNCPIQGMGACIMRKSVELAQEAGLKIPYTLHDALYILDKTENIEESLKTLANCMDKAFRFYFKGKQKYDATVGLEADIWSKDFDDEVLEFNRNYYNWVGNPLEMEVKKQKFYVDPRGKEELEKFKKYFELPKFEEMEF